MGIEYFCIREYLDEKEQIQELKDKIDKAIKDRVWKDEFFVYHLSYEQRKILKQISEQL